MSSLSTEAGQSRRFLLRARTAEAHDALDRMIGPFDSLESYRRYLAGIGGFRLPLEAKLRQAVWPLALEGLRPQDFGLLIRQDQDDLGMTSQEEPGTEETQHFEGATSAAALFGTLYVLEGSNLGARLLYKRAQALGLGPDHGARHLAAQAERNDRWSRFLQALEAADAIEIDEIALASRAAFAAAQTAFRRAFHGA
ncbi:hypothetical protein BJF93_18735 [Xaviernesmea oryzae]|uniref:Heme oxygenase n=1 Tax=Xaviernesmea oryzae TaxID=464029 RepID=A0A1Q9B2L1_9HYPH|nr:biliverdin-producing heme oxygenase [Xaviernesmea oryzae]OLP62255.1 hypothetical protein BJF93_18735 [Xaviernesmea oryzae]SEL93505.1 heme oxygenase [Xaviernesmea oryzae]